MLETLSTSSPPPSTRTSPSTKTSSSSTPLSSPLKSPSTPTSSSQSSARAPDKNLTSRGINYLSTSSPMNSVRAVRC
ncbi:hypothetical protein QJS04_geneDACA012467 [Acorus gramineus]|uniref:REJ domain-containing protein n=1 Tax=Acorus gramineus TaxID=55184 RepID=A0AAV9BCN3_ACOGR|nr:hypothetical protein QJS04_geneDACA012467 [Acorus gramineus]